MVFLFVLGLSIFMVYARNLVVAGFCSDQMKCYSPSDLNYIVLKEAKESFSNPLGDALTGFYIVRVALEPTFF